MCIKAASLPTFKVIELQLGTGRSGPTLSQMIDRSLFQLIRVPASKKEALLKEVANGEWLADCDQSGREPFGDRLLPEVPIKETQPSLLDKPPMELLELGVINIPMASPERNISEHFGGEISFLSVVK